MSKTLSHLLPVVIVSCLAPAAWGQEHMNMGGNGQGKAIAVLRPTKGNQTSGVLHFAQSGDKVKVTGEITGLAPGQHGFHIHEFGDCSAEDAASAGPHFDAHKGSHGSPSDQMRHTGDLGNIAADAQGRATVNVEDAIIALSGHMSIIGRGVIVHTSADDLKTQPTGNAGARLACGVVGIAKG